MGANRTRGALVEVPNQLTESKKAEELVKTLRPLVKKVLGGPPIRTDEAFQEGSDARRVVVTTRKQVEGKRRAITTHMDAAKRAVMNLFKPMTDECSEALEQIDGKLESYEEWKHEQAEKLRLIEVKREEKRLETLRRNERKKLMEAESRAERLAIKQQYDLKKDVVADEAAAAQAMVDDSPPVAEGTSVRMLWDYQILHLSEVPEHYIVRTVHVANTLSYCRQEAKAGREPKIRGLRLFQKPSRASRKF